MSAAQTNLLAEFLSIFVTFIGENTDDTLIPINANELVDLNKYFNCSKWIFADNEVTMPITINPGNGKSGGSGTYHCGTSNLALIVGGFDLLVEAEKNTINVGDEVVLECSAKFWSTFEKMESYLSLADATFQILDDRTDKSTSDSDVLSLMAKDAPDQGEASYLCVWTLTTSIKGREYSREYRKTIAVNVLGRDEEPTPDPPHAPGPPPEDRGDVNTKAATDKVEELTTKYATGGAGDETRRHSGGILMSLLVFLCYCNLVVK